MLLIAARPEAAQKTIVVILADTAERYTRQLSFTTKQKRLDDESIFAASGIDDAVADRLAHEVRQRA